MKGTQVKPKLAVINKLSTQIAEYHPDVSRV
jgi:hypothetical protein